MGRSETHYCMYRFVLLLLISLVLPAAAVPPNILFLFSDDQRADTIAALGNVHVRTPSIDKLVARGTTFTRAYCMGSTQGAVCVPSRAMLMSGRTLWRIEEQLGRQPTWPEAFSASGYSTFITGKWHNGRESVRRIFQQGRAIFLGGMTDPYSALLQDFSAARALENKRPAGEHCVKLFADSAIGFLKAQPKEKPFLCYVSFNAPHDPKVAPKPFHEHWNAHKPPVPANFLPVHPFSNGEMRVRDEKLAPWPRTPEIVQQHLADYSAAIEYMDQQIGRILDGLKEAGHADNTIVVFTSDHGLAIGSHGLFGKQNLYDHSMRVPLVMAGPGVREGMKSDAMCYLLDIFPTLGEKCGIAPAQGSEGKSFDAVLAGRAEGHRTRVLTAYRQVQRAIRDDRWKLILYPKINRMQLFDLKSDPWEMKDLAADPARTAEVKRLTTLMEEEQALHGDRCALSSPNPEPAEFDYQKGGD